MGKVVRIRTWYALGSRPLLDFDQPNSSHPLKKIIFSLRPENSLRYSPAPSPKIILSLEADVHIPHGTQSSIYVHQREQDRNE
jgi:hypothetical protein